MPKRIGAVALTGGDELLVALADGVYLFDPNSVEVSLVAAAPHSETVVLHEGKCDRQGRFWIGSLSKRMQSHGELGGAFIYRLEGNRLLPQIGGLSVANGMAWSPDGSTFYHTDTPTGLVWSYDYDVRSGAITGRREFLQLSLHSGMADGAAVDTEGRYWLALYRGGKIVGYLPSGATDREVPLPVSQPTMPAFGGSNMATMFVTSTRYVGAEAPGYGDLFAVDAGVMGIAETPWSG